MGLFLRWMEIKESTSRKRAVKAALKGERPSLPGSYAANPRTDVQAMDVADKSGVVRRKYMNKCPCEKCDGKCPCGPKCPCGSYHEDQSPDYSLDQWIDMADDLSDDISLLKQKGDEEEENLDKDKEKTKKDKKYPEDGSSNQEKDTEDDEEDDEEQELWSKFQKAIKVNQEKDSSEKSSSSP